MMATCDLENMSMSLTNIKDVGDMYQPVNFKRDVSISVSMISVLYEYKLTHYIC